MMPSASVVAIGLALTGLGTVLLLLSLRSKENDRQAELGSAGVVFIGPISIIIGGSSNWSILGIAAIVVFFVLVAAVMAQPEFLGL